MREFLPLIIVGAIIGTFALLFLIGFLAIRKHKYVSDLNRHMTDGELVKRLLHYAKPHWKSFVLCLLIMLFSVVYDVISPLIIGQLVELVQGDFTMEQLLGRVGFYASILVVSLICTYFQAIILQKTGQ